MSASSWWAALRESDPKFLSPAFLLPINVTGRTPARALVRRANAAPTPIAEGVKTHEVWAGEDERLRLIVHRPDDGRPPAGALVWFFGGGLISGSADHANAIASSFAQTNNSVVVVPDYRTAPESPYPAALDDCFAALEWTVDHHAQLGLRAESIAVGGESAGAGLAAAVAQKAHDRSITLCLQLLIHPMLDDRTVPRAEEDKAAYLAWTVRSNRYGWTSYLGHAPGADEERPYAVPARREDLSGLAPAWISVGTIDQFHDECIEYADRLEAAGVPCELHLIERAHHGAEHLRPHHHRIVSARIAREAALERAFSRANKRGDENGAAD